MTVLCPSNHCFIKMLLSNLFKRLIMVFQSVQITGANCYINPALCDWAFYT